MPARLDSAPFGEYQQKELPSLDLNFIIQHRHQQQLSGELRASFGSQCAPQNNANNTLRVVFVVMLVSSIIFTGMAWSVPVVSSA
jgi:hypothetical protein